MTEQEIKTKISTLDYNLEIYSGLEEFVKNYLAQVPVNITNELQGIVSSYLRSHGVFDSNKSKKVV